MSYSESDFQAAFNRWLKFEWEGGAAAFELKICKTKSLPFSRVEPHQVQALLDTKHGMLIHKISDTAVGFKPFDSFILSGSDAFIAIMFYEPRRQKRVCMIDIDTWVKEEAISKRRSITKERAEQIAWRVFDLMDISNANIISESNS